MLIDDAGNEDEAAGLAGSTGRPQPPVGGAPADGLVLGIDYGPAEPLHQQRLLVAEMVWAELLVDRDAGI
jgi:hypothetical protein